MAESTKKTIILGIDPGLASTGFGVIEQEGGSLKCLDYGTISTKAGGQLGIRLKEISEKLCQVIDKYEISVAAVEEIYFCKNVKSALAVGQAKGAVLLSCSNCGLPVYEYTPLQIKQAITGYGKADKNQIQQMVKILLRLKAVPHPDHAADALAVAICCAHSQKHENTKTQKH